MKSVINLPEGGATAELLDKVLTVPKEAILRERGEGEALREKRRTNNKPQH